LRVLNFRDEVIGGIARKMGFDPTADLPPDLAATYVTFINSWLRKLWSRLDWPESVLIEQRTPASHYIPWAQTSQNVIDRAFKVFLVDPRAVDAPSDVPFRLDSGGVFCGFEHGTNVWLKYLPEPPFFTTAVWSATVTYAKYAGTADKTLSVVYDPVTGWNYQSLQATNLNHAITDGAWWSQLAFPADNGDLIVHGAYADALREDGQTDKALAEEQALIGELEHKIASRILAPYDPLTDQAVPAARYRAPGLQTAATK